MAIISTHDSRYDIDTDLRTVTPRPELPEWIARHMPTITPVATFDDYSDYGLDLEIRMPDNFSGVDPKIAVYEREIADDLRDEILQIFGERPALEDSTLELFPAENAARPAPAWVPGDGMKVGAILVSAWGYDMTIVDWYQVVRMTKASVWVIPIAGADVPELSDHATFAQVPVPEPAPTDKGKMYRLCGNSRDSIKINSSAYASLWGGAPVGGSRYD